MTNPIRSLLCAVCLAASLIAFASDGIESRPVHFAKGTSSATINDSIKGDQSIDYKLVAKAGQTMRVALKTSNTSNYFNVLPPGSTGEAIFVGSSNGNEWSGQLPADGEYSVRVYLLRNAARRDETAKYTLSISITGGKSAALGTPPATDSNRQTQFLVAVDQRMTRPEQALQELALIVWESEAGEIDWETGARFTR